MSNLNKDFDEKLLEKVFAENKSQIDDNALAHIGDIFRSTGRLIYYYLGNTQEFTVIDRDDMTVIMNSFKTFVLTVITISKKYRLSNVSYPVHTSQ